MHQHPVNSKKGRSSCLTQRTSSTRTAGHEIRKEQSQLAINAIREIGEAVQSESRQLEQTPSSSSSDELHRGILVNIARDLACLVQAQHP
jgi:hypothetical protein